MAANNPNRTTINPSDTWLVEYCDKGGTFGRATVFAPTPGDAVAIVNGSELVAPTQTRHTRARIWTAGGVVFSSRSEAYGYAKANGDVPVFAGVAAA